MASQRLTPQTFSSSVLNRSTLDRREAGFIDKVLPTARILLVSGNQCCIADPDVPDDQLSLKWHSLNELEQLGFEHTDGLLTNKHTYQEGHLAVIPFLLGHESKQGTWKLAADVSALLSHLKGLDFRELRSLMPILPMEELAVAGHAVALSQWHASNPFCSRCGAPNMQVEAGGKVQCTAHEKHRAYPRTDPVAIMMVEDTAGQRALLGRPKKLHSGVLTCLSGFIEQGESIEEAVRREVLEESGIKVGEVAILGSQPWPIGRGGSCELMIGCIAKALSDDLKMDREEMDEVRWISREDVKAAVEMSSKTVTYEGRTNIAPGLDFYIPPSWAIAHHLICAWANQEQPWFSKL